jgi:Zn finger protein HypA/HybF involved in hydrogenase expression
MFARPLNLPRYDRLSARTRNVFVAAISLAVSLAAQPRPAAFIGSVECGKCHPAQFARQSSSAHATALFAMANHPLARSFLSPRKFQRNTKYQYEIDFASGVPGVHVSDNNSFMHVPLEWAFGAGRQAVTFLTRLSRDWYLENYLSYYSAIHSFAASPGHDALQPASLPEAAGVVYPIHDAKNGVAACFECHSTGPVAFGAEGEARVTEAGVRCESCHGPGAAHAANPARTRLQTPRSLSAAQLNEFCGRCHRPPAEKGIRIDWNYAWNIRHQPIYLSESRCFRASKGALSCFTCHDPHESAGETRAADYNRKCENCHSTSNHPPKPACSTNCIDCHMPRVSPQAPLRFTNHWIGIYSAGSKLRPVR